MTTCVGKRCSFGLLCEYFITFIIFVCASFPIGFEGGIWGLIVFVPDHYLSFYFASNIVPHYEFAFWFI